MNFVLALHKFTDNFSHPAGKGPTESDESENRAGPTDYIINYLVTILRFIHVARS
jgi:hypothetical protein